MSKLSKRNSETIRRAQFEAEYHKNFDYNQKDICDVCGEQDKRHTVKCIHFKASKSLSS